MKEEVQRKVINIKDNTWEWAKTQKQLVVSDQKKDREYLVS